MENYNIIIPSVGGQGGLTLKRIIDTTAVLSGKNVCGSTRKGLSQREGHVISFSKIGSQVYSPKVKQGNADIIIGLEPNETLKSMYYCSQKTKVVFNTRVIPAYAHEHAPLEEILKEIKKFTSNIKTIDATIVARKEELGRDVYANLVMLGAAYSFGLKNIFTKEEIKAGIEEYFKGKNEEIIKKNKLAFDMGTQAYGTKEPLVDSQ